MTRQFNPSLRRVLLGLAMLGWAAPVLGQGQPPTQPIPPPAAKAAQTPAAKPAGPRPSRKGKQRRRKAAKPAVKRAAKPVQAPVPAAAAAVPEAMRRDPFRPLVSEGKPGAAQNLPPGKAGLVISSLRVEGSVRAPSGMIAVVANPQERVYFLREGDQLYDGIVEKITLDEVYFRENTRDAFGRPLERTVVKRIYSGAEEQSGELR